MFVTNSDGQLLVVRHIDHALLCGELALHWGNDTFESPQPAVAVRLAAEHHDDGWRDPDDRPLVNNDTGRPLRVDEVDLEQHVDFYRPGVESMVAVNPYAGLLMSMHWTGLYEGRWGTGGRTFDPSKSTETLLKDVVLGEERRWIDLRLEAWDRQEPRAVFERRLWTNYDLLQAWDLLSIFVCTSPPGKEHEASVPSVPVNYNGYSTELRVWTAGDERVVVDPFPFADAVVDVGLDVRQIPDRRYGGEAELRECISRAPIKRRRFQFRASD